MKAAPTIRDRRQPQYQQKEAWAGQRMHQAPDVGATPATVLTRRSLGKTMRRPQEFRSIPPRAQCHSTVAMVLRAWKDTGRVALVCENNNNPKHNDNFFIQMIS